MRKKNKYKRCKINKRKKEISMKSSQIYRKEEDWE